MNHVGGAGIPRHIDQSCTCDCCYPQYGGTATLADGTQVCTGSGERHTNQWGRWPLAGQQLLAQSQFNSRLWARHARLTWGAARGWLPSRLTPHASGLYSYQALTPAHCSEKGCAGQFEQCPDMGQHNSLGHVRASCSNCVCACCGGGAGGGTSTTTCSDYSYSSRVVATHAQ